MFGMTVIGMAVMSVMSLISVAPVGIQFYFAYFSVFFDAKYA